VVSMAGDRPSRASRVSDQQGPRKSTPPELSGVAQSPNSITAGWTRYIRGCRAVEGEDGARRSLHGLSADSIAPRDRAGAGAGC
jgi:hypothetical protein